MEPNQVLHGQLTAEQISRIFAMCGQLQAVTRAVNGNAIPLTVPTADLLSALDKSEPIEPEAPEKSRAKRPTKQEQAARDAVVDVVEA